VSVQPSHNLRADVLRFLDYCVEVPSPRPRMRLDQEFPDDWMTGLQLYAAWCWWRDKVGLERWPMQQVQRVFRDNVPKIYILGGKDVYLARLKKGVGIVGQRGGAESVAALAKAKLEEALKAIKEAERARVRESEARRRARRRREWQHAKARRAAGNPPPAPATTPDEVMLRAMPIVDVDAAIREAERLLEDL
jgi:hypothetical protein